MARGNGGTLNVERGNVEGKNVREDTRRIAKQVGIRKAGRQEFLATDGYHQGIRKTGIVARV